MIQEGDLTHQRALDSNTRARKRFGEYTARDDGSGLQLGERQEGGGCVVRGDGVDRCRCFFVGKNHRRRQLGDLPVILGMREEGKHDPGQGVDSNGKKGTPAERRVTQAMREVVGCKINRKIGRHSYDLA